jgi:hypothetical protein
MDAKKPLEEKVIPNLERLVVSRDVQPASSNRRNRVAAPCTATAINN